MWIKLDKKQWTVLFNENEIKLMIDGTPEEREQVMWEMFFKIKDLYLEQTKNQKNPSESSNSLL